MSDEMTHFRAQLQMKSREQAQWLEAQIEAAAPEYWHDKEHEHETWPPCQFRREKSRVYLGDIEGNANIAEVARLIHEFLKKFERDDRILFTWGSSTTPSPKADSVFGGGAVAVTSQRISIFDTSQLAEVVEHVPPDKAISLWRQHQLLDEFRANTLELVRVAEDHNDVLWLGSPRTREVIEMVRNCSAAIHELKNNT